MQPVTDLGHAARVLVGFLTALRAIDPTDDPASEFRGGLLADHDRTTRSAVKTLHTEVDQAAVLAAWSRR